MYGKGRKARPGAGQVRAWKMGHQDHLGRGLSLWGEAMNWPFKNRIALKPSEVELHYLESIKDLEKLGNND